jgi:mono/diheme cytochrome c family protein
VPIDFVSVFILLLLLAAFGWLTMRAWHAKRAVVKWPGLVVAGVVTLMLGVVAIFAALGFYKLNERRPNPVAEIRVAGTPDQVARGQRLAHLCASCHSWDDQVVLSGSDFIAKFGFPPVGTFYAPNLTPSGSIRDWSDGEVTRAIREGVHKNGRSLLIMPAETFRNFSDEDAQAVVAYLRSQPATGSPTPTNQFNVFGALFLNLADLRTAQPPVGPVSTPPSGTREYGKYIVDAVGCRDCHGAQLQGKLDLGEPGPPPGPNLTRIVPQWTEEEFMTFFNTGVLPGGRTVPTLTLAGGQTVLRMPWPEFRAALTDDELKAMYAYLHSLPALDGPTAE